MQRATRVASHRLPLCSQWDRLRALKTRCDKPPHRQDYNRANNCADEPSAFARLIPPDRLAEVCCYKSSNNPEHGRQDVPSGLILVSWINQFRDHPCHKPNYDGPKNTHCVLSFALISVAPSSSPLTRPMHTKKWLAAVILLR